MEIDPLKIPAFMRKRRATKDTSFKPTPKFKSNPNPSTSESVSEKVSDPRRQENFDRSVLPSTRGSKFYDNLPAGKAGAGDDFFQRRSKSKVFSPAFEAPLFAEPQNLPEPSLLPVGIVTHYYDKIKVAVLKLSAPLKKGASVQLMGEKRVFNQKVNSMQINRVDVPSAPKGAEIGIKVKRSVVTGEIAYTISSF